jgi:hypothetical protein
VRALARKLPALPNALGSTVLTVVFAAGDGAMGCRFLSIHRLTLPIPADNLTAVSGALRSEPSSLNRQLER